MANTHPVTEKMVELYAEGKGSSIQELMELFDATQRSVVTRLSRAGVYVKPEKATEGTATKRGQKGELLQQAEQALGLSEGALKGVTIENLERIIAKVAG